MIIQTNEQQLAFDFEFSFPTEGFNLPRERVQELLRRIVPDELLSEEIGPLGKARFQFSLPIFVSSDLSKAPCRFSILMLCKHRTNGSIFFYDLVSRWVLPSKKGNVELFFSSDVRLPHLTEELLSVAEIMIHLKSVQEVEEVKKNFEGFTKELRLGLVSSSHAHRILEHKGLMNVGKRAMTQEKIHSLNHIHSNDFGRGIFTQMQQFLDNCDEEFKSERDYHHVSRIISNLYSIKKLLKQKIGVFPKKRQVYSKFLKTQLSGLRLFLSPFDTRGVSSKETPVEGRHVLGVMLGLNFMNEQEGFATTHLLSAIQRLLPNVEAVPHSSTG